MALTLRAKNSNLTEGAKFSFLTTNYASGVSAIVVTNSNGFAADDYLLIGSLGNETSEVVQIDTGGVNAATHTLTLKVATKFAHPESTKVTIIKYNQVLFYQTATTTFDATENPLPTGAAAAVAIQADSLYTIIQDSDNSTGWGWFKFENATNSKISAVSNFIPYSGFGASKVKTILDSFYSLLNSKERKLITDTDALNYMSEGLAILTTELNLSNDEYNVSGEETVAVVSGTSEYSLPDDFEKIISLYNGTDKEAVTFIPLDEVSAWDAIESNTVKFYLRGSYIGISPEPTESENLTMRYKKKSSRLTSYSDDISLPGNSHYILLNWLMFRAHQKLTSGQDSKYYELFQSDIQRMKVSFSKRDNNLDAFGISPESNV